MLNFNIVKILSSFLNVTWIQKATRVYGFETFRKTRRTLEWAAERVRCGSSDGSSFSVWPGTFGRPRITIKSKIHPPKLVDFCADIITGCFTARENGVVYWGALWFRDFRFCFMIMGRKEILQLGCSTSMMGGLSVLGGWSPRLE